MLSSIILFNPETGTAKGAEHTCGDHDTPVDFGLTLSLTSQAQESALGYYAVPYIDLRCACQQRLARL